MGKEKKPTSHFNHEFAVLPGSTKESCKKISRVQRRDQNLE